MEPLVSVIVPVYNVEQYLHQCVDSILGQTFTDLEIWLVDDGSPDRCPDICDQYQRMDSRIKVIHQKNAGLGNARNSALERITGTFVVFIDSDDWIDADHIQCLVHAMNETKADVAVHGHKICATDGSLVRYEKLGKTGLFNHVVEDVLVTMISTGDKKSHDVSLPVGACFKIFKTGLILKNGLRFVSEKEYISEDTFFNIDYLRCCNRAVVIDEYGYNYRYNPRSISHRYDPKRAQRTFAFFEKLHDIVSKDDQLNRCIRDKIAAYYLGKCRVVLQLAETADLRLRDKVSEFRRIVDHPSVQSTITDEFIRGQRTQLKWIARLMKKKRVYVLLLAFYCRRVLRTGY